MRYTITSKRGWRKTVDADNALDAAEMAFPDRVTLVRENTIRDLFTPRHVLATIVAEPESGNGCLILGNYLVQHVDCTDYPKGTITSVLTGKVVDTTRTI